MMGWGGEKGEKRKEKWGGEGGGKGRGENLRGRVWRRKGGERKERRGGWRGEGR